MEQLVSLDWRMCPTLRHKAGPKISFQILSEKQKLLPYQVETNEKSPNSYCTVCKHQNPICQLSHNPQSTQQFFTGQTSHGLNINRHGKAAAGEVLSLILLQLLLLTYKKWLNSSNSPTHTIKSEKLLSCPAPISAEGSRQHLSE